MAALISRAFLDSSKDVNSLSFSFTLTSQMLFSFTTLQVHGVHQCYLCLLCFAGNHLLVAKGKNKWLAFLCFRSGIGIKHCSQMLSIKFVNLKYEYVHFETGSGLPVGDIRSSCYRDTVSSIQRRQGCHLEWGLLNIWELLSRNENFLASSNVGFSMFLCALCDFCSQGFQQVWSSFLGFQRRGRAARMTRSLVCHFFGGHSDIILSYGDCLFNIKLMNGHISED